MKTKFTWNWIGQVIVVLVCVFALKSYYSTASADQLRWILAPTAASVELVTGCSFDFEPHAGYINRDRSFLIANSCAGVNFLITAFLMLSIRKLLSDPSKRIAWVFIPATAAAAYVVTLIANTTRISIALWLQRMPAVVSWLNPYQLHRFEGIVVYFGFLLLLFKVSEKDSGQTQRRFSRFLFPLLVYYATVLGVPMVNGAYRQGRDFWEHSLFVLFIPIVFILPILAVGIYRRQERSRSDKDESAPLAYYLARFNTR